MRVVHASVTIVDGRKITDLELAQMPLVGRRVRFDPDSVTRLRKVLLWSRAEMAAELGVAPLTVSRWERGQSTPQAKNLGDLVDLAFRHQVAFEPWCNPSR